MSLSKTIALKRGISKKLKGGIILKDESGTTIEPMKANKTLTPNGIKFLFMFINFLHYLNPSTKCEQGFDKIKPKNTHTEKDLIQALKRLPSFFVNENEINDVDLFKQFLINLMSVLPSNEVINLFITRDLKGGHNTEQRRSTGGNRENSPSDDTRNTNAATNAGVNNNISSLMNQLVTYTINYGIGMNPNRIIKTFKFLKYLCALFFSIFPILVYKLDDVSKFTTKQYSLLHADSSWASDMLVAINNTYPVVQNIQDIQMILSENIVEGFQLNNEITADELFKDFDWEDKNAYNNIIEHSKMKLVNSTTPINSLENISPNPVLSRLGRKGLETTPIEFVSSLTSPEESYDFLANLSKIVYRTQIAKSDNKEVLLGIFENFKDSRTPFTTSYMMRQIKKVIPKSFFTKSNKNKNLKILVNKSQHITEGVKSIWKCYEKDDTQCMRDKVKPVLIIKEIDFRNYREYDELIKFLLKKLAKTTERSEKFLKEEINIYIDAIKTVTTDIHTELDHDDNIHPDQQGALNNLDRFYVIKQFEFIMTHIVSHIPLSLVRAPGNFEMVVYDQTQMVVNNEQQDILGESLHLVRTFFEIFSSINKRNDEVLETVIRSYIENIDNKIKNEMRTLERFNDPNNLMREFIRNGNSPLDYLNLSNLFTKTVKKEGADAFQHIIKYSKLNFVKAALTVFYEKKFEYLVKDNPDLEVKYNQTINKDTSGAPNESILNVFVWGAVYRVGYLTNHNLLQGGNKPINKKGVKKPIIEKDVKKPINKKDVKKPFDKILRM